MILSSSLSHIIPFFTTTAVIKERCNAHGGGQFRDPIQHLLLTQHIHAMGDDLVVGSSRAAS